LTAGSGSFMLRALGNGCFYGKMTFVSEMAIACGIIVLT
jgi:hypothetical protein